MRLELPISEPGPGPRSGPLAGSLPLPGPGTGSAGGVWRRIELGPSADAVAGADAESAPPTDPEPARYYERHEARPDRAASAAGGQEPPDSVAAPCLLIVSPLLPLPRSLPALLQEAIAGEADFRLDWKWPILTPRAGPWELVVQMCVGTSLATGYATGRVYIALDAGSGAYLIVCIDRDPQKIAARQKELLALLAGARLHRDRVSPAEAATVAAEATLALATDAAGLFAASLGAARLAATEVIPPQQPPPEIYLKEALFSYLTD